MNKVEYGEANVASIAVPVFIKMSYLGTENFAFLILKFYRKVCKSLKKEANFEHILLFLNVCKQTLYISRMRIFQKVKDLLM